VVLAKVRSLPLRRLLPKILIVLGICLLSYSAIQYGRMYFSQRQLTREWSQQNQSTGPHVSEEGKHHRRQKRLTRILAPKIQLDYVVVEGISSRAMMLGPGHMKQTALPGEPGNAVITAHRDTFFRHINELSKGDEIFVQRDGRSYRFAVTGKRVVEPTEVSVLDQTEDSRLTLITCYPTYYIGPAPQRLVVFARLVSEAPTGPQPNSVKAASYKSSSPASLAAGSVGTSN
jgi:LPXTG-site transpeptidase (sortase) family protein